jgi:hypothetical protein
MKDRVGGEGDIRGGHGDRIANQIGAHMIGHRPPDHTLGVAVDHRGQV